MASNTNGLARSAPGKKNIKKDIAASYNEFKEFEGQQYTGMKIGRSHKWYYDKGEWKETKITPDLWQISYAVTKRRSGVPVGTEYHWYILAHQNVKKLNANDYSTSLTGLKYKLAHKRADKEKWSTTERTQRRHLIKILQELIKQLEKEPAAQENGESAKSNGARAKKRPLRTKPKAPKRELAEA